MRHTKFFSGQRLSIAERKLLLEILRSNADSIAHPERSLSVLPILSDNLSDAISADFRRVERDLKHQDPVAWSLYLDEMNNAESFMREVNKARKNRVSKSFQPADGFIAFHFDD